MLATPLPRGLARSPALASSRGVREITRSNAPAAPIAPRSCSRLASGSRRGVVAASSSSASSSSSTSSSSTQARRLASDNLPPLRVVVTGGSKGIGRALVEGFLTSGDDVAFCSRDASRVAEAEREVREKFSSSSPSPKIFSAPCDVSKPGDARRFAAQAAEALGGLDVWINNAGMSTWGSLADDDRATQGSSSGSGSGSGSGEGGGGASSLSSCDEAEIAAVVATNVTGTILGTRAAILAFSKQQQQQQAGEGEGGGGGGHIYNMDGAGSDGGATPNFAAYGASKLALASLHKSVKAELKELGLADRIGVHRISPGMVTTDLLMKGTGRPRAKFFVNVLAESPGDSVSFFFPSLFFRGGREGKKGCCAPIAPSLLGLSTERGPFLTLTSHTKKKNLCRASPAIKTRKKNQNEGRLPGAEDSRDREEASQLGPRRAVRCVLDAGQGPGAASGEGDDGGEEGPVPGRRVEEGGSGFGEREREREM